VRVKKGPRALGAALAMLSSLTASGCFFYDSRWGESTAEQKRAAERLRPADVKARPEHVDTIRRARIRGCATSAYVAETVGWEQRFDELVKNANGVLEPALGLHLESGGTAPWKPSQGGASLETALGELSDCDSGDVDWVVGFVESTPKLVTDFHHLGMAREYSKYLVVRAPNDPAEMEGLAKGLPDIDESARQKLYADRRRHKVLTLFLHELAHTLGAVHRTLRDTIMSPTYDSRETGFDEATLGLLRITLADRFAQKRVEPDAFAYLSRSRDGYIEEEWQREVDRLSAFRGPTPTSRHGGEQGAPASGRDAVGARVEFETLPKSDRQTFDAALALEHDDPRRAWQSALQLFERYPAVLEIQELRCRLAQARRFYRAVVEAHCARRNELRAKVPEPVIEGR
jgi:hypothetical protein